MRLKALKSKETDFKPQTLGEHIKKRRLILNLYQREVAERLGVDEFTVLNWETEQSKEPHVSVMPAILDFLGYNPFPKPITLPERLLAARRLRGWTMREAARFLGIDESTWRHWEHTGEIAWERNRRKIDALLAELHL